MMLLKRGFLVSIKAYFTLPFSLSENKCVHIVMAVRIGQSMGGKILRQLLKVLGGNSISPILLCSSMGSGSFREWRRQIMRSQN